MAELGDPLTAEVPEPDLEAAMATCVRAAVFGPAFADGLADEYPGTYSSEELACLGEAYSALPAEDYDALIQAGLDPQGPSVARAVEAMASVFDSCDAPQPAGF